jgi:hypothetical protein
VATPHLNIQNLRADALRVISGQQPSYSDELPQSPADYNRGFLDGFVAAYSWGDGHLTAARILARLTDAYDVAAFLELIAVDSQSIWQEARTRELEFVDWVRNEWFGASTEPDITRRGPESTS